jgi:hypothetical protein
VPVFRAPFLFRTFLQRQAQPGPLVSCAGNGEAHLVMTDEDGSLKAAA